MILGVIGTAALLALSSAEAAQTSNSPQPGASGAAEMGRSRCEALSGAEREKCRTEERASAVAVPAPQRSEERK